MQPKKKKKPLAPTRANVRKLLKQLSEDEVAEKIGITREEVIEIANRPPKLAPEEPTTMFRSSALKLSAYQQAQEVLQDPVFLHSFRRYAPLEYQADPMSFLFELCTLKQSIFSGEINSQVARTVRGTFHNREPRLKDSAVYYLSVVSDNKW